MIRVNNKKFNLERGMSIEDLLNKVKFGEVYSVVRINGRLVSKPNFGKTIIKDKSEITLIPMIAGG